jgi:hypothetical protein
VFAASIVESLQRHNPENVSSNEYAVDVDAKLATPPPIASPGAGAHCQCGADRLSNARIYDWLDDTFGLAAKP